MKECTSELKKRALAIVDIYSDLNKITEREANILREAITTERPQGEWIFGSTLGHAWMKCSNCCVSQSGQTLCWSYCPNCGAEMKGGEDHAVD